MNFMVYSCCGHFAMNQQGHYGLALIHSCNARFKIISPLPELHMEKIEIWNKTKNITLNPVWEYHNLVVFFPHISGSCPQEKLETQNDLEALVDPRMGRALSCHCQFQIWYPDYFKRLSMEKNPLGCFYDIPFSIYHSSNGQTSCFFYTNELTLYDYLPLIWLPVPLR